MVSSMTEAIVHCLLLLLLLLNRFSRVQLCAASQMTAHQAPSSLGSSRQEHWTGLPFPSLMHEVKSESEVAQSRPTLRNPMDCSLSGSSVHGIFQARVLEWGAITFSVPCSSYCKQCYNGHWGTCVSFNSNFLGVYAQQWDCQVIRQFCSQFFKESPHYSSQWLYKSGFPPTVLKGFPFLHTLPAFIVCRFFDDGPSDQCGMISHCGFDLHFSDNE